MSQIKKLIFGLCLTLALFAGTSKAGEITVGPQDVLVNGTGTWAMAISLSQTVDSYGALSTSVTYSSAALVKTAGDTTDVLLFPIEGVSYGDALRTGFRKVTAYFVVSGAALDAAPTAEIRPLRIVSGQQAVGPAASEASDACIDASAAAITTAVGHYRCTITLTNRQSLISKERFLYALTVNGGASTVVKLTGFTLSD